MLILASASPRRRELLSQIGQLHRVVPADIDEAHHPGEAPTAYVQRLALEKARAVLQQHPADLVLAADTTVTFHGHVLNKPRDREQARHMLLQLAANTHHVHTGLALLGQHVELTHLETTAVTMTPIPHVDLETYLQTGDSLDKAGAYGIQGYAARWVSRIEGDYFNVVGLPLAATVSLLRQAQSH